MSCNFCRKYDFNTVAVKDNNINLAGGNTTFTNAAVKYPEIKMFRFCPLCGCSLFYTGYASIEPIKSNGKDVFVPPTDGDGKVTEEEHYASQLMCDIGVSTSTAKEAYAYATARDGGYGMMVAYCKAKIYAVKTNVPFDTRVDRFMEDMK